MIIAVLKTRWVLTLVGGGHAVIAALTESLGAHAVDISEWQYLMPPKGLLSMWWAAPFFNYSGTLSVDTFFFISVKTLLSAFRVCKSVIQGIVLK
jgi:hypothetical protein